MKIYIRRRLTPDELLTLIGSLEVRGWSEDVKQLAEAYRAYEEEGELSYSVEEEITDDIARRVLSLRVVELINLLKHKDGLSISEIARELNRSPSNVYVDLKLLSKHKLVYLERQGKRTIPHLIVEELHVIF